MQQTSTNTYFGRLGGNGSFSHGGRAPLRGERVNEGGSNERLYVIMHVPANFAPSFKQAMDVKESGAEPDEINPFLSRAQVILALGLEEPVSDAEVESALEKAGVEFGRVNSK